MNRFCSLVLAPMLVLGIACGSSQKSTETPETTPTTPTTTAAGALLGVGEIKISDSGKDMLAVHANGDVQFYVDNAWKTIGKLTADGKFVTADNQTGQLQSDGTFTTPDGPAPFKLDGAALVVGEKRITIENGKLIGGNPEANTLVIAGADSDGTKRTALLLLGLLQSSSGTEAQPATGSAVSAPPAPPPTPSH